MKTSYFGNKKNLEENQCPIGIVLWKPRWFGGKNYRPLAPTRATLAAADDKPRYQQMFEAQLAGLDPNAVVSDLDQIADGKEPVLMCYEKPPFTAENWCHRTMVAEWLHRKLGLVVEELPVKTAPKKTRPKKKRAAPRKPLKGPLQQALLALADGAQKT